MSVATKARPWLLEVWEPPTGSEEPEWVVWSTCRADSSAYNVAERLIEKGHQVRVRNEQTGEILLSSNAVCGACEQWHRPPYDGTCLL